MNVGDMILVSIDDHVIEPRDMFLNHVPDRWKGDAPRSVVNEQGIERWVFQGEESVSGSLNAVVGWPKEDWDPFRHLERSEATVAALRDRTPDVDTTIRSKHEWRARYETAGHR